MNAVQEIIISEEAARAGVAAAIAARDEAQQHLDAAQLKHAEAQARIAEREEAFKQAHEAHQRAVDKGADDKATLARANEVKALADAARVGCEKASTQLGSAKLALERADGAIAAASGQVLAAIARKQVADFREGWRELIQVAARLYALRARCTTLRAPIPAELLDKSIDAAATDSAFPLAYRKNRDGIAEFLDQLSNDPQASFDFKE
jgi:hypothetical protein